MSVPILVAFLLWPEGDRIALPGFLASLGVASIPVAFVLSFVGSIFGSFFTAPFIATLQSISKMRLAPSRAVLPVVSYGGDTSTRSQPIKFKPQQPRIISTP